jgi:S-adenosylmethionine hydrolase
MKNRPVVTLLTDFGQRDPFVGIMKGVILGLSPAATIVDLCHEVPPYQILSGSFLLASAVPYFSAGTIHVAVVDPGVGGSRRPILAHIGNQFFVAPDNGLLSYPMAKGTVREVRVITAREYLLDSISATFHGRDVFAPVAGHLACGVSFDRFGSVIPDALRLQIPRASRDSSGALVGEVLWIDRFGNCVTSITQEDLTSVVSTPEQTVQVRLLGRALGRVVSFFGAVQPGGRGAIVGSTGHLELFVHEGNLAQEWSVTLGTTVTLEAIGPQDR